MRLSNITEKCDSTKDATYTVSGNKASATQVLSWLRTVISYLSGATTGKGVIAFADQAVVSATNFVTGVIIGRVCTKSEFDFYMLGLSIVFLLTQLTNFHDLNSYTAYNPRLQGRAFA